MKIELQQVEKILIDVKTTKALDEISTMLMNILEEMFNPCEEAIELVQAIELFLNCGQVEEI